MSSYVINQTRVAVHLAVETSSINVQALLAMHIT